MGEIHEILKEMEERLARNDKRIDELMKEEMELDNLIIRYFSLSPKQNHPIWAKKSEIFKLLRQIRISLANLQRDINQIKKIL